MKIEAAFVTSASGARDLPPANWPEIALVGRSNVGKSSLINALARQHIARTSAAPGKTRLANFYRISRGRLQVQVIDLPGYGYARGGSSGFGPLAAAVFGRKVAALLLVDARHPGLPPDLAAWSWLRQVVPDAGIVATKIDKLTRGQRVRAVREIESVFDTSVVPLSVVTGEGMDELWKLIDRQTNSRDNRHSRRSRSPRPREPRTVPRKSSASTSRR